MRREELKPVGRCPICKHEDREGIELLGLLACSSWNIARKRINNTFGTNFSVDVVRRHMLEHPLHRAAMEQGVILDAMRGDDGAPVISVDTMLQTVLVQGMLDLAKGKIRCKSVSDLIAVTNALQNIQEKREAKMVFENGDLQGFYAAMAAYGEAIRSTVSPQQRAEIMMKANALGAVIDIGNIPLEQPIDIDPEEVMSLAVRDYKELGRSRTRDELVESGALDVLDDMDDLDLPE